MAASWSAAAARLARAVTRRERGGALLSSLGAGALAGGAAALVLAGAGVPTPAVLPVGVGLAGGLLWGGLRAARTPAIDAGAAAWALDRMGAAGEAGLAEATLGCPAPVATPRVRLKPWAGLPLAVGGALVAALALARDAQPPASPTAEGANASDVAPLLSASAGASASAAASGEATAQRERQALEAARVRAALGLGASLEPAPSALTQALEDPAARRAALAVADPGSPLAQALAAGSGAEQDVADRLARGLEVGAALATARRAALAAATADPAHQVPAVRRPLVERHAALLRAPEDR